MQPDQHDEPLSLIQLEKIDDMLVKHGEKIAATNKRLFVILSALCDPTHDNSTLKKVEKSANREQPTWRDNILHVDTKEDGRKSAWHTLNSEFKRELMEVLKNYKALAKTHKPLARTLTAFKAQLGVHDDMENADYYTITLGDHITKQYEIRGKDKIFFAGQNDFLAFFHDIWWKTLPPDIKTVREELSSCMRIIREKTKKGYTVRWIIDSSWDNWNLQCTVMRDKQVYQRTYELSFRDLKKMIDGLIGKEISYEKMFTPIKKTGSGSSLSNYEEDEEEDEEDDD